MKEYKQKKITDYYKSSSETSYLSNKKQKIYGYNKDTDSWHCLDCGEDMGPTNPRQLCGKTYCRNIFSFDK